jgi:hypothetical protein
MSDRIETMVDIRRITPAFHELRLSDKLFATGAVGVSMMVGGLFGFTTIGLALRTGAAVDPLQCLTSLLSVILTGLSQDLPSFQMRTDVTADAMLSLQITGLALVIWGALSAPTFFGQPDRHAPDHLS